jgi:hypothetical protein
MVILDTDFIIGYLREAPKIIEIALPRFLQMA